MLGKTMTALERQQLRLRILKVICEYLHFDLNNTMVEKGTIFELIPDIDKEEIIKNILYLGEKGYLKYSLIHLHGYAFPTMIQLLIPAIDLVEKMEMKMPTDEYENDFSKTAITNFSNITNSQIIVNSPGSNITITDNQESELIAYLNDLVKKNNNNIALRNIVETTVQKIKQKRVSMDFLKGIGSALMSFGISITSNLLTPSVAHILGLNS